MQPLKIVHFSDVLCIWAHVGQRNLVALAEKFGDQIQIETHFCSVFPDTRSKITRMWHDRGGFDGYASHVRDVADKFDAVGLHGDVWSKTRPRSSASPHLFIKAVELLDPSSADTVFPDQLGVIATAALRDSFFSDAQDIADWTVQQAICDRTGMDFAQVREKIESGEAIAELAKDYELAQDLNVKGSPTYILNEGRQTLFGNISYGILDANISELLRENRGLNASPC